MISRKERKKEWARCKLLFNARRLPSSIHAKFNLLQTADGIMDHSLQQSRYFSWLREACALIEPWLNFLRR